MDEEKIGRNNLAVSTSGIITDQKLIEPGVTVMNSVAGYKLEDDVILHIFGINVRVGAAATVTFKIGSETIYITTLTGAGDIDIDFSYTRYGKSKANLTVSCTANTTIIGNIVWGFEFAGGPVAQVN